MRIIRLSDTCPRIRLIISRVSPSPPLPRGRRDCLGIFRGERGEIRDEYSWEGGQRSKSSIIRPFDNVTIISDFPLIRECRRPRHCSVGIQIVRPCKSGGHLNSTCSTTIRIKQFVAIAIIRIPPV